MVWASKFPDGVTPYQSTASGPPTSVTSSADGYGAAIAHCPRSNRAHGHGSAPLAAFRTAGLRVGLGTDSVVSVGDLDLWSEAQAAGLDGDEALRALTLDGARALGWGSEIGSLDVGKSADLAVFDHAALRLSTPSHASLLTVVSGRIVHQISAP